MAILRTIPAGDLDLVGHKLVFTSGPTLVRQKLSARFQFFAGEWFLDRRQGIPYFRDVFTVNPNRDLIRALFKKVVVSTPGVASLIKFDALFDTSARQVRFDFAAKLSADAATLIVTPADRDFLVDVSP